MPATTETIERLRQEVAALTITLQAIETRLHDVVTHSDLAAHAETARRLRRRTVTIVAVSVVIALVCTMFANNAAITACFLGSNGSKTSSMCDALFPGRADSVRQGNNNLQQFRRLIQQVQRNQHDIDELKKRGR